MRGKRPAPDRKSRGDRIIPAHAGQTDSRRDAVHHRPDHPRACGANSYETPNIKSVNGSSPRMRGKRSCASCRNTISPDHPRACGANLRRSGLKRSSYGSSPRMRGKRSPTRRAARADRIIPAHAGQTACQCRLFQNSSDHPRACGANSFRLSKFTSYAGSSPRMRGKPCSVVYYPFCYRIIPAHAGQTRLPGRCSCRWPDHPRACGANEFSPRSYGPRTGSSPRMRGKPQRRRLRHARRRIIPAHAGQTRRVERAAFLITDHPRACGANTFCRTIALLKDGSSPRMRGKHGTDADDAVRVRIIPAHAGQTETSSADPSPPSDHPRACGAN